MVSLILVISGLLIAASANSINEASREVTETERIVRGRSARSGQFPYAAALYYNNRFVCTSSIISSTALLTAAHCVVFDGETQDSGLYYAIANVNKSATNVRIDFASVTVHPDYDGSSITNDIAIFKTTEPIPFNDEVKPICIARANTTVNQYQRATIMGWGNTIGFPFTRVLPPNIPDILQYAGQRIVRNSLCPLAPADQEKYKICATGGISFTNPTSFFSSVCNGDSGGPLVSQSNPPVQIGITSYGLALGCGAAIPEVFTRVSFYNDFIKETAGEDSSICEG